MTTGTTPLKSDLQILEEYIQTLKFKDDRQFDPSDYSSLIKFITRYGSIEREEKNDRS